MKSLVSLWTVLARELAVSCGIDAERDISTLSRRAEDEGDSFLRITLPNFGKAFDRAVEEGRWSPTTHTGFRQRSGLPLFLGGFLGQVFGADGALLPYASTESIRAVRQLTAVFGKIEGTCTPARNQAAIDAYCDADDECASWDENVPSELLAELAHVAQRVIVPFLASADKQIADDRIVPRHGPGQTADRLLGNQKYDLSYWPAHLEARFPWSEWAVPNYRFAAESRAERTHHSHVVPARLTLVPKTMSSPRVIVMEPTAVQYMQQAILTTFVETIERNTTLIGFTDQQVNRDMARKGSIDGSLATLDLSEASDRVTYSQAASVFRCLPNLWEALRATRSKEVHLEGRGGLFSRPIHKFASMGSAVCFPVEATVFLSAIFMAIRDCHREMDPGFDLTASFVRKFEGRVRVYGDDIVVPVEYLPSVERIFSLLGWRVNRSKTFSKSNFRESCGGDYWRGHDVTPVRQKAVLPTHRRQIEEIQSTVELRNRLYLAGYWETARFVDGFLYPLLRGVFPIVEETAPGLGRISVSFQPKQLGTDRYQRVMTRAWVVRNVIPKNPCSETGALLKYFIAPGKDDEHLLRSGRPVASSIKLRWIPIR